MQYTGLIKFIGPREEVGANALPKQTIVLEEQTDREFKGGLAIDFFKEKIDLLEGIKVGDVVTAYINTRVNESKTQPGRFFNSISCRKLEKGESAAPSNKEGTNEDLPF